MLRSIIVAVVVATSAIASAQQSPEVTKYLQATIALYENLEYAKALAQVQKAKTKAKTPDDEARCSVLEAIVLADMGKDDKATKAFQSAFSFDPELKLPVAVAPKITALAEKAREQVKKMLAPTMAAQKADEEKRLAEEKAKADAIKAEEDKRRAEAVAQQQKEEDDRRKAMQPPPAVVKRGPPLRSLSWIPGVVGVLTAGVATVAFLSARASYNSLVRPDSTLVPSQAVATRDGGRTMATLGWISSGIAVAGIGAAVVMFIMGNGEPAAAPPISFMITPGGGSLSIFGSFDVAGVAR